MTIPFEYPPTPHNRRHGPVGYADYASYRPWLRDEFAFRCVFCLRREVWGQIYAEFAIDHCEPVVNRPDLVNDYDNLLYACAACNTRKSEQFIADPLTELLANAVTIRSDGRIEVHTRQARQLVRVLQLDLPELTEFRAMWISIVHLAERFDPDLYGRLLGYPKELPDLASLKPPGGNTRPDGIEHSYYRQREIGELPELYRR